MVSHDDLSELADPVARGPLKFFLLRDRVRPFSWRCSDKR